MKYSAAAMRIVKIDEVAKEEMKSVNAARRTALMKMTAMPGARLALNVVAVTSRMAAASSSGGAPAICARVSARTVDSRSHRTPRKSADMSATAAASSRAMPQSFPRR